VSLKSDSVRAILKNHFVRPVRNKVLLWLSWFDLGLERFGLRLQLVHYYSETPSRRVLRATANDWARPVQVQFDWDLTAQLAWLNRQVSEHLPEVAGLGSYEVLRSPNLGPGYGPIESQLLHCLVRHQHPRRILEVGSGVSTMVALKASERNAAEGGTATTIDCIEPFPRSDLVDLSGISLHRMPAQDAPTSMFTDLGSGDILFIDSTHAVKTGSELARLYLEVLPSLRPGVLVHIHDIFLPYCFSPTILADLFDWQETTLVAALLTGNPRLQVRACLSALHHERSEELGHIFPDYDRKAMKDGLAVDGSTGRHFPSSLWLEVCGG
jgi:hypothetical protein